MRKCASGGQGLANAERGVEMCGFVGKIDTELFITFVHLYIIIGNPGPNILVAHFRNSQKLRLDGVAGCVFRAVNFFTASFRQG